MKNIFVIFSFLILTVACKNNSKKILNEKPTQEILHCYHFIADLYVDNCDSVINKIKQSKNFVSYIDSSKTEFKYRSTFNINNKDIIYTYTFRPIDRNFTIYRYLNSNNNTMVITNLNDEYPYIDIYIPTDMLDSNVCNVLNDSNFILNALNHPNKIYGEHKTNKKH